MSPVSFFHLIALASLILVAWTALSILVRQRGRLARMEMLGLGISGSSAMYWMATSYLLSNIWTCRADATLCIAGGIYQLLRNLGFLIFHKAIQLRLSAA